MHERANHREKGHSHSHDIVLIRHGLGQCSATRHLERPDRVLVSQWRRTPQQDGNYEVEVWGRNDILRRRCGKRLCMSSNFPRRPPCAAGQLLHPFGPKEFFGRGLSES